MLDDPNFAYTYLRPVAVVIGASIGYALAWNWLDRRIRKQEKGGAAPRNVTPARPRDGAGFMERSQAATCQSEHTSERHS